MKEWSCPRQEALGGGERVCTRPRRQRPVPGSGSAQGSDPDFRKGAAGRLGAQGPAPRHDLTRSRRGVLLRRRRPPDTARFRIIAHQDPVVCYALGCRVKDIRIARRTLRLRHPLVGAPLVWQGRRTASRTPDGQGRPGPERAWQRPQRCIPELPGFSRGEVQIDSGADSRYSQVGVGTYGGGEMPWRL